MEKLQEPRFKSDFVKRVEEAKARAQKGEKLRFKPAKEMRPYPGRAD